MSLFAELNRRRVFRAVIGYGIVTFALLQVVEPVMHGLHLPEVTLTFVVVALAFGFPLTVAIAWAFDVKASGIEWTSPAPQAAGLRGARLALLLAGVGALAAAPGLIWYFAIRGAARQTSSARAPSIVVLPFVNLSADAANEYFSDGITEELIDALTHVEGLQVVSRTSAFSFKGKPTEVSEIGVRLKVATVLEGSVRREGTRLRLTAQLVDTANGFHLWSQIYEREMKDVFAVEGELAKSIVDTLRPQLMPAAARAKAPTEDLEAHDLYLRGRHFWNRRTPEGLHKAVSLFEEALRRDPRYALAYAGLADAYLLLPAYAGGSKSESKPKARAAAQRALELDPDTAEAHATLGFLFGDDYDWKNGEAAFRRAIALNPGYATAHHWYAELLYTMGRLDEALAEATFASRLDPSSLPIHFDLTLMYLDHRQYDRAIEHARQVLDLDANGAARPHRLFAMVYVYQREFAESLAELNLAEQRGAGPFRGLRASIYGATGRRAEVLRLRAELDDASRYQPSRTYNRALIDITLGDLDRAFAGLKGAIAEKDFPLVDFKAEPVFDPIRSDPRFSKLLHMMNLD